MPIIKIRGISTSGLTQLRSEFVQTLEDFHDTLQGWPQNTTHQYRENRRAVKEYYTKAYGEYLQAFKEAQGTVGTGELKVLKATDAIEKAQKITTDDMPVDASTISK